MMITNLANRSLSHFLINNLHICMNDDQTSDDLQTDLKMIHSSDFVHICMKNIDFFTYIIIDRYTSEMFYDIMIDSKASIWSIVDYEQYLAFIKNIFIDLNRIKTNAVNVQFEIESISSIESLIIDTFVRVNEISRDQNRYFIFIKSRRHESSQNLFQQRWKHFIHDH
jgi:hypothetical protein